MNASQETLRLSCSTVTRALKLIFLKSVPMYRVRNLVSIKINTFVLVPSVLVTGADWNFQIESKKYLWPPEQMSGRELACSNRALVLLVPGHLRVIT